MILEMKTIASLPGHCEACTRFYDKRHLVVLPDGNVWLCDFCVAFLTEHGKLPE